MGDSLKEMQENFKEVSLTRSIIYRVLYFIILCGALGLFGVLMFSIIGKVLIGEI